SRSGRWPSSPSAVSAAVSAARARHSTCCLSSVTGLCSALPRSAPAGWIDQPLDRVDVVDGGRSLRCLACRGPERIPCAPGRLRLRVELDRDGLGPVGFDPRSDLLKLAVQVGLDLVSSLKLAASAVHPADLTGEQPQLATH